MGLFQPEGEFGPDGDIHLFTRHLIGVVSRRRQAWLQVERLRNDGHFATHLCRMQRILVRNKKQRGDKEQVIADLQEFGLVECLLLEDVHKRDLLASGLKNVWCKARTVNVTAAVAEGSVPHRAAD